MTKIRYSTKIEKLATELMGWPAGCDGHAICPWGVEHHRRRHHSYRYWNPYENIADAVMVWDKLIERGYCASLIYDDEGRHWALVSDGAQERLPKPHWSMFELDESVWYSTRQEAICEAALKTLEVEE